MDKPCERPCDQDLDQMDFSPTQCIKDYIASRVQCYARGPQECSTKEELIKISEVMQELSEIEVRNVLKRIKYRLVSFSCAPRNTVRNCIKEP